MKFFTDENFDYDIQMTISGASFEGSGMTTVAINNHHIETIEMIDDHYTTIIIPRQMLYQNGQQTLTFETSGAISPSQSDLWDSDDYGLLGIRMYSIELSKGVVRQFGVGNIVGGNPTR